MRNILLAIGCVILCNLAGIVGALLTNTGDSPWYQSLNKPSFNPPGWVFGPVWTLLYTMMGIALFLLIRQWPASRLALVLFGIQLALNALWTPVFFGMQQMGWAIVVIVMMWLAIVATMVAAWRVAPAATWLLAPYLAWVSFATVLNVTLWRMN